MHCIRLQLNLSTVFEQGFERLHIIEKQAIFDHVLIVTCQCLQRIGGRYELKTTRDGSVVVDEFAARSFLGEERALVFGDCLCERFVCNRRIAAPLCRARSGAHLGPGVGPTGRPMTFTLNARIETLEKTQKRGAAEAFLATQIAAKRAIPADKHEGLITLHMRDSAEAETVAKLYPNVGQTHTSLTPPAVREGSIDLTALNAEQQGIEIARLAKAYQADQGKAGNPVEYAIAVQHISEKLK